MNRWLPFFAIMGLLALSVGCEHPITAPKPASQPTPTATATLGCITSTQWTVLSDIAPDPYGVVVLAGTQTPQPSPTPFTGVVPTNLTSNFVIRNQADWVAYVAASDMPGLVEPLPFNPNTQMLLVIGYAGAMCSLTSSFNQVCYGTDQVTVYTTSTALCCGNPPAYPFNRGYSLCIVVPRSDLPVVWNNTYVPLPPNAYLYCV
jgi:hypothetical protein